MRSLKHESHLRGNPAQNEAITHGEGACLVLAGPGSGKTFVITERGRSAVKDSDAHVYACGGGGDEAPF